MHRTGLSAPDPGRKCRRAPPPVANSLATPGAAPLLESVSSAPLPRRAFLRRAAASATATAAALTAPHVVARDTAAGYTGAEIDERLARGQPLAGLTRADLPTPSLLLDLDAFEANVAKLAAHTRAAGLALRPHAKTHKCVEIARRQRAAGAVGVCVATLREAEAMAAGGIGGLLITSELAGPEKIRRLLRLVRAQPDTLCVVDQLPHAEQLDAAARAAGLNLPVLLDVDPGSRRTGVAAGAPAETLARVVARLPHLRLRGFHCYSGSSAHVVGYAARRDHSHAALAPALASFAALRRDGLPLEVFSGGSTGTYNIDPGLPGLTELQCGSYVFMDVDYRRIGGRSGALYEDFAPSLTVLATVISQPAPDRATVDAGLKAFATDKRFGPDFKDLPGAKFSYGGDEHGIVDLAGAARSLRLGDRLEFIVPHCDPNVNLYDRFYCLRGDRVEAVWPIARGYA